MKKAIYIRMIVMAVAVLLFSAAFSAVIMNRSYETDLKNNIYQLLKTTDAIADPSLTGDALAKQVSGQASDYRVTVIAPDGTVLGDSYANYQTMENHLSRMEVKDAFAKGQADTIRYSDTQKTNVFYAARKMSDGNVMRIAVPMRSYQYDFSQHLPGILLGIIIIIGFALFLAARISRSALKPLEAVSAAMKEIEVQGYTKPVSQPKYEELIPLVNEVNDLSVNIRTATFNLQAEKEKLAFLLDSMRQGLIVVDRSLKIVHHNQSVSMLFDAPSQLTGKSLVNLTHDNKILTTVDKCFADDSTAVFYMNFSQSERIYSVSVNPIKADWIQSGVLIVFTDVTEQRKAEQMRREFFDNASHELKTPITAIKGFSELLLTDMIAEKQKSDCLARIHQEAEHMTKLIDDILGLSRLEENKLPKDISSVDILELAQERSAALETQAVERNITISVQGVPVHVSADRQDMQRLLSNLIENAVKYNKENGSVTVNITKEKSKCLIAVRDTGIGISAKDIPRIFERFYRVDKGRSRSVGGTGLGLSIVKHIVAAYGGEINVKSVLGEGTLIEIQLKAE